MRLTAFYPSTCTKCHEPIKVGHEIVQTRTGYAHRPCLERE